MKTAIVAGALTLSMATAHADLMRFEASLGPEAVGATGSGSVTLVYDTLSKLLEFDVDWSGLSGTTTVAHIHCCVATPGSGTAGVAVTPSTLPGFPSGVSTGSYNAVVDLGLAASYTGNFLTAAGGTVDLARDRLLTGMGTGVAYFNIHSSTFLPGEIRGFLQAVPEPSSLVLAALALGLAAAGRRRRGG
jgi:MYXO-CTERM domain-containing protein